MFAQILSEVRNGFFQATLGHGKTPRNPLWAKGDMPHSPLQLLIFGKLLAVLASDVLLGQRLKHVDSNVHSAADANRIHVWFVAYQMDECDHQWIIEMK